MKPRPNSEPGRDTRDAVRKPIRWAVVGTGAIAETFANDIRFAEAAELVAVCSRDGARAEAFADRHGIAGHMAGLDALLAHDGVDAVYLATPNAAHFDMAEKILKAGRPLLIEKPMTVTSGEAERLGDLAARGGTFLMEAMWTRYLPAHVAAKRAIESGAIGTVTGLSAELAFKKSFDPDSRFFARELGGGALRDLGVYTLSMAEFYLGRADMVEGRWIAAPSGVDESATLHYRKGVVTATLSCGFDRDGANLCVVEGTRGAIIFPPPFIAADGYFMIENSFLKGLLSADGGLFRKAAKRVPIPGVRWNDGRTAGTGLEHEITAASNAIRDGLPQQPAMPVDSTIEALRRIEGILASPPA